MSQAAKTTAQDLCTHLQKTYNAQRYCLGFEVANKAGFDRTRYADAIAIDTWPSGGCAIHGMEIKISLSDLKAELADPSKSEAFAQFCDYWWLVVPEALKFEMSAVPTSWGVVTYSTKGRRSVKRDAPLRADKRAMPQSMLAALLKRVTGQAGNAAREEADDRDNAKIAQLEARIAQLLSGGPQDPEKLAEAEARADRMFEQWRDAHRELNELLEAANPGKRWKVSTKELVRGAHLLTANGNDLSPDELIEAGLLLAKMRGQKANTLKRLGLAELVAAS